MHKCTYHNNAGDSCCGVRVVLYAMVWVDVDIVVGCHEEIDYQGNSYAYEWS